MNVEHKTLSELYTMQAIFETSDAPIHIRDEALMAVRKRIAMLNGQRKDQLIKEYETVDNFEID